MKIWLVGAGPMAGFHAEVLRDLDHEVTIIATSATRAAPMAEKFGMKFSDQGLSGALDQMGPPDAAVVALPVDMLAQAALELLNGGVKKILLEKPGGLNENELANVSDLAREKCADVYIAYNRRFLSSTIEAKKRIAAAGGALSVAFEFCENSPRIEELPTPANIKAKWLIANSTHVIDMAFYMCGFPIDLQTKTVGALSWHPSGAYFSGQGETDQQTAFSYNADWRGPGRWGIEIVLPEERLVLRPIEQLQVMPKGKFQTEVVEVDDELDTRYKPGLYLQMQAFLTDGAGLVTAQDQCDAIANVYNKIANY